jgi:hypothetical protein
MSSDTTDQTDGQTAGVSRRSMLKATGIASTASLLPLGAAARATETAAERGQRASQSSVTFSDPVRINPPQRYGYEPSVTVDQYGNLYATAHKASLTNEGTQLSSFFWYSIDGGETWYDMPSPAGVEDKAFAFEGDIAVDAAGMVYYVDTYLGDNHLHRWKTAPGGPIYDLTKPVMGSTAVDDRPWIRGHGDGVLYYLGNNGTSIPDLEGDSGRIFFYRSTNGGLTFTVGESIPTGYYVSLAESKADNQSVYLASPAGNEPTTFDVFSSHDRGKTFTRETVGTYETAPSNPFPAWSVTDFAGNPYHVWADDDPADSRPGILKFTRRDGSGDWETLDITPFEGTFTKQWIGAGREGFVAVVFYATRDVPVKSSSDWFPYALVTTDAGATNPHWSLARLTEYPVATDGSEPEDFFEVAVGPFDRIHVTFAREIRPGTLSNPTRTYRNNIFYTQGTVDT